MNTKVQMVFVVGCFAKKYLSVTENKMKSKFEDEI